MDKNTIKQGNITAFRVLNEYKTFYIPVGGVLLLFKHINTPFKHFCLFNSLFI